MADDIVTRLRISADLVDRFPKAIAKNIFSPIWLTEAADEIERLRTTGKELLDALTEMAEKGMLPKITFRMRDAAEVLEKQVRDV